MGLRKMAVCTLGITAFIQVSAMSPARAHDLVSVECAKVGGTAIANDLYTAIGDVIELVYTSGLVVVGGVARSVKILTADGSGGTAEISSDSFFDHQARAHESFTLGSANFFSRLSEPSTWSALSTNAVGEIKKFGERASGVWKVTITGDASQVGGIQEVCRDSGYAVTGVLLGGVALAKNAFKGAIITVNDAPAAIVRVHDPLPSRRQGPTLQEMLDNPNRYSDEQLNGVMAAIDDDDARRRAARTRLNRQGPTLQEMLDNPERYSDEQLNGAMAAIDEDDARRRAAKTRTKK